MSTKTSFYFNLKNECQVNYTKLCRKRAGGRIMTVIIFRAWDKLRKRMSKVDRIYIDTQGVQLKDDFGLYWRKINDVVLEQYTGVRLKDGMRVFEGDIVKYRDIDYQREKFYDAYAVVAFEKGQFVVKERHMDMSLGCSLFCEKYQVVGNIHENPELLEEK